MSIYTLLTRYKYLEMANTELMIKYGEKCKCMNITQNNTAYLISVVGNTSFKLKTMILTYFEWRNVSFLQYFLYPVWLRCFFYEFQRFFY